jgi:hypothetical protein
VREVRVSLDDSTTWYLIFAQIGGAQVQGWVRADTVQELTDCPTTD